MATTGPIEAENAALRAEVAELKRRLAAAEAEAVDRERLALLEAIIQKNPNYVYVFDLAATRNVFVNRDLAQMLGFDEAEIRRLGPALLPAIMHPDDLARMEELLLPVRAAADDEVVVNEYRMRDHTGEYRWFVDRKVIFARAPDGTAQVVLGTIFDIDESKRVEVSLRESQRRAEDERVDMQAQIIAMQEATIRELESPLLPIAPGVVVMPIVGQLSEARSRQIVENLLAGISRTRAAVVILDITGVRSFDAEVAAAVLQAARAAKLLGTRVGLTGASPAIAMTMVELGADLGGITTLGTLQAGIAWAMQAR